MLGPGVVVGCEVSAGAVLVVVGGWRDDAPDAPRRGACFGGIVCVPLCM